MPGSFIIPTAIGLAIAKELEKIEEENLFILALEKLRSLKHISEAECCQ